MRPFVIAVVGAALLGCPPPAPERPSSDDLMVDAEAACANLRRIGCPEGQGSVAGVSCAVIVVRATALRSLPLACWTKAQTTVEAKSCGSLRCTR